MKGQHAVTAVVSLVLIVLVLFVAIGVSLVLRDLFRNTTEDAQCASQIKIHSAVVGLTGDLKAPDITCPTERISVDAAKELAEPVLAREMQRCWDRWGQGKLQLFGDTEGVYCHVCSVVSIEHQDEIKQFPLYLAKTKVPGDKKDRSYFEYLQGVRSDEVFSDADFSDPARGTIETQKPVGVIFYYVKGQQWYTRWYNDVFGNPVATGTVGAVGGGIAGGIIAFNVVALASSVGLPVAIIGGTAGAVLIGSTAGTAAGGWAGFIGGIEHREPLSHLSGVVVRPLSESDIGELGCQYAPVSN